MNERGIVSYTYPNLPKDETDWEALRNKTDEEIERAIADDPDAAPLLDEAWFASATIVPPLLKTAISLRVDGDVLDFFKSSGPGYQTRMNAVLRAYMQHAKAKKTGKRRA
ncbi:MAG: uncharacterized protein JWM77_2553 [Rhodospirillales bacterium]|nr:uncharacterized protein [Rhodospirillales bacterium]